jgi:vancomycin permeability regulator SanA
VLGAAQYNGVPTPDLRARLDHAVSLWRANLAPLVVVTGGKEPGDTYTEASTGGRYLRANGVPPADIILESTGRDSWQSFGCRGHLVRGPTSQTGPAGIGPISR